MGLFLWCWMFQAQHNGKLTVVEFDADQSEVRVELAPTVHKVEQHFQLMTK